MKKAKAYGFGLLFGLFIFAMICINFLYEAPINHNSIALSLQQLPQTYELSSFTAIKSASNKALVFPYYFQYLYLYPKGSRTFMEIYGLHYIYIFLSLVLFSFALWKTLKSKVSIILTFFLILSTQYLHIATRQSIRPFCIFPFVALFIYFGHKLVISQNDTLSFFLFTFSVFIIFNLYPWGILALLIYGYLAIKNFRRLSSHSRLVLLLFLILLSLEGLKMNVFNVENIYKGSAFLNSLPEERLTIKEMVTIYLRVFSPSSPEFQQFLVDGGGKNFLMLSNLITFFQTFILIVGIIGCVKNKALRFIVIWYMLPFLFFHILRYLPVRYLSIVFFPYFLLIGKGMDKLYRSVKLRWVRFMGLLLTCLIIAFNLSISIYALSLAKSSTTLYFHSDDRINLYYPTYSKIKRIHDEHGLLHDLTRDKLLQRVFLKDIQYHYAQNYSKAYLLENKNLWKVNQWPLVSYNITTTKIRANNRSVKLPFLVKGKSIGFDIINKDGVIVIVNPVEDYFDRQGIIYQIKIDKQRYTTNETNCFAFKLENKKSTSIKIASSTRVVYDIFSLKGTTDTLSHVCDFFVNLG